MDASLLIKRSFSSLGRMPRSYYLWQQLLMLVRPFLEFERDQWRRLMEETNGSKQSSEIRHSNPLISPNLSICITTLWMVLTEQTRSVRTIVQIEEIIEPGSHSGITSFKQHFCNAALIWMDQSHSAKKKGGPYCKSMPNVYLRRSLPLS